MNLVIALFVAGVCFQYVVAQHDSAHTGHLGQLEHATAAPEDLLTAIREHIRDEYAAKTKTENPQFDLISFRKQVVQGHNYFCKVKLSDKKYAHLRVHYPLPSDADKKWELTSYQEPKTESDPIEYF